MTQLLSRVCIHQTQACLFQEQGRCSEGGGLRGGIRGVQGEEREGGRREEEEKGREREGRRERRRREREREECERLIKLVIERERESV